MEPISQFFVISPRGDTIIARDFRGDMPKGTNDTFFSKVKNWNGKQQDAPPVFNLDGVNYLYIKKSGLYFMCTSKYNVAPSFVLELISCCSKVFKDYCGVMNEESIRKNFVLVYELLEEMIDDGYPQWTSSDSLKSFIFNEPIIVANSASSMKVPEFSSQKTTPSNSVDKPIASSSDSKSRKNEIFVDIYEKINVTFNPSGYVLSSDIEGTIQMKSYLAGNPELKLALNEELVVGKSSASAHGAVVIDSCNFHESVKLENFERDRTMTLVPPDGEFTLMMYRISGEFRTPFRVFPLFDLVNPYKIELIIKVRADIPEQNYGGNVVIQFPVPKTATSCTFELAAGVLGQATEFVPNERKAIWRIKKFGGGTEHTLRAKISLSAPAQLAAIKRDVGPISLTFEIPMYNVSNLQVRYLRINEANPSYNPYRWVRYVTKSNSYVCRI